MSPISHDAIRDSILIRAVAKRAAPLGRLYTTTAKSFKLDTLQRGIHFASIKRVGAIDVNMTILDMLRNGVVIETLCGQIYTQLERASSEDKEAAKVFAKMGLEEEKHAAFLQDRRDILKTRPASLIRIPDVHGTQLALIEKLRDLKQTIGTNPPQVDAAIRIAMQIERDVERVHEHTIQDLIESTGKLADSTIGFEAIKFQESQEHEAELNHLAETRGIAVPSHAVH